MDLTLTQHPHNEEPEIREVCICLEIKPLRAWYYCISSNFRTLVILLQIFFTFGDEPETIYEGFSETEDISIFAWSSVPSIGHYHWLCGLVHRLVLNSKADYLVHTICHILYFL